MELIQFNINLLKCNTNDMFFHDLFYGFRRLKNSAIELNLFYLNLAGWITINCQCQQLFLNVTCQHFQAVTTSFSYPWTSILPFSRTHSTFSHMTSWSNVESCDFYFFSIPEDKIDDCIDLNGSLYVDEL